MAILLNLVKSPELAIPDAVSTMQNVLPRRGARAYTVSDDASADQRYFMSQAARLL